MKDCPYSRILPPRLLGAYGARVRRGLTLAFLGEPIRKQSRNSSNCCYNFSTMQTNHASIRNTIRLLLLGILLAAQTFSFAHDVMHLSGDETEMCEMCRIQSSPPAIIDLHQHRFVTELPALSPPLFVDGLHGSHQLAGFHSRAPPRLL